ncbi:MAG: transposase [Gemmatimonadetes bacterium]|nr:transposase [Gemmatimonadota bacterium]
MTAAGFPRWLKRLVDLAIAFSSRPVRCFFQDETRLGLHESTTRRRITARGVKPIQLMLPRYEYLWFYGAVEPASGDSFFLELPALDTVCFQAFLDEFSRAFPDTLNVLVLDGAGAHVARALVIPDNVLLARLPPYSPELNPIERVWLDIRKLLGDALPASLRALADTTATILRDYTPHTLASLTDFGYPRLLGMHS